MADLSRISWPRMLGVFIVVVSFIASAGATVDYALAQGIHPWTARILPISLEACVVLATLVWHAATRQVALARLVFWAGVAVTWLVNFAHADGGVAGVLAAMPTLSLPAGLHLAFDLPRATRARHTPRHTPATRPATRPATPPAAVTSSNGHTPATRKMTQDDLRSMFGNEAEVLAWLERYQTEHPGATHEDAWTSIGATLNQGNRLRRTYREATR